MGELGQLTQKALLPVENCAILSHIFKHFGPSYSFVIAYGSFVQDLRNYCALLHPEYQIRWVEVQPTHGPGSGPGRSVLCCRGALNTPFYLVCSDTLWTEPVTSFQDNDWIGAAQVSRADSSEYCNLLFQDDLVLGLKDKTRVDSDYGSAFIGLAYIKNFKIFFDALEASHARELSLAHGFEGLIKSKLLRAQKIPSWKDSGTLEKYRKILTSNGFSFSKSGEHFYHVGDQVAKFSIDTLSLERRFKRGQILQGWVPEKIQILGRFLSYQFEPGKTLYEELTPDLFQKFLQWLDRGIWSSKTSATKREFKEICWDFYFQKTHQRIDLFLKKYPDALEWEQTINGEPTPALNQLLKVVPWLEICSGSPVAFHGDLHPDNIIYNSKSDKFTLIDWRPDFAGELEAGDLYYEFTKLRLGLEIHLGKIRQGKFTLDESEPGQIKLELPTLADAEIYLEILNKFMIKKGLDPKRLPILVALACINMAALHEAPYDQAIFHEGRRRLKSALQAFQAIN